MDQRFLQLLLALGVLLFFAVMASKISTRYGIPILLLFIGAGVMSGFLAPLAEPALTQKIGTIALAFILFSGGLSTHLKAVGKVWKEGLSLALLGVIVSTSIMAVIIHFVTGWGYVPSALLGAAISSTDAAAVFGIIKTRKLNLKTRIQSTLELESGSNDPMGVFLTLSLIKMHTSTTDVSLGSVLLEFFLQMSVGAFLGWFAGQLMVKLINRLDLEFEGLYPVLTVAFVLCLYSFTESFGGNGFLAAYLAGLVMGDERYFNKKALMVFHDGLAWLMQVAMFLALGLLIVPEELMTVAGTGLLLSLGLMFVARPLSVFLCLIGRGFSLREIFFLSWGGLRGAVPIILGTYILVSKGALATTMFNLVFFIVLFCMLIQGTSLRPLSKWLGVQEPAEIKHRLPFKSRTWGREFLEYEVSPNSPFIGKAILELNLPEDVLIVLIHRQSQDFIPRGNTEIEAYDRLICLADQKVIPKLEKILRPIQSC